MRRFSILAPALAAFVTGACVSSEGPKRIQAFADATSLTVQNVGDAFDAVERSYTELQIAKLALDYDTKGFDPEKVAAIRFLPKADLDARLEALDALKAYAETLALLAGSKKPTALDEATKALGKELTGLNDAFVKEHFFKTAPASAAALNASATALNAIGRWLIDLKREPILEDEIAAMQGPVRQVCDLLIEDLGAPPDAKGEGPHGLRLQLWNQYTEAMRVQGEFIAKNASHLDAVAKRAEIKALVALVGEQRKADATLESTQRAVRSLGAAHARLGEAYGADAFQLDRLIGSLVSEATRIRAFYASLGKS